jgi:hypothetical protein
MTMTNQPKSTVSAPPAQNPAKKSQALKIKLGDAKSWIPGYPCTAFVM